MSTTKKMKSILKSGEWLTDEHISFAQDILKKQFPGIDGFQSPLLAQNDSFSVEKNKSIQIHHIAGNHWVTSCSFNQEVAVYDSKFTGGDLCPSLTKQLAQIYKLFVEKEESMDTSDEESVAWDTDTEVEEDKIG